MMNIWYKKVIVLQAKLDFVTEYLMIFWDKVHRKM